MVGRGGCHDAFWWGNLKESCHLEYIGLDGKITLKCISILGRRGVG
jgi:hypothetical protein